MPSVEQYDEIDMDPESSRDFTWDWQGPGPGADNGPWLPDGVTIVSASVTSINEAAVTVSGVTHDATTVTARITVTDQARIGGRYRVSCAISASNGETEPWSIMVHVHEL
ncbi:MAG: hypothetical protein AAFZ07_19585 [Actinomycetota bacterium]